MVAPSRLPNAASRIADARGSATQEWRDFFLLLASTSDNDELQAELNALALRVTDLENNPPGEFTLQGLASVIVNGTPAGGYVQITLDGDESRPGPTWFYGTGPDSAKGWYRLYDGVDAGVGIVKTDSGYVVLGEVAEPTDLPGTGNVGEAYRVLETDPGLYAWDGAAWVLDPAADGIVGVQLMPLANTGVGIAPVKIYTRDAYGRIEGDEDADTDDLPEGATNLYFTAARVRATVLTGLSLASSAAITAADTVLSAFGKLQAQITALASTVTGLIVQTITNGDTTHAPSGDAVFDALKHSGAVISLAANQSIPNATGTMLSFGAEDHDTDNYHDTVTNPSRLTVPTAGVYVVDAGVVFASDATGYRQLQLFKNGASFVGRPIALQPAVSGIATGINCSSAAVFCVAGDYFEAQVTQTSGGALNALQNNGTWLAIRRVATA